MGQVKNFDADFGGTEIFEPLQEIFKQIKQTEKKTKTTKMTHIYLLTDGAVDNTSDIINLVKKNFKSLEYFLEYKYCILRICFITFELNIRFVKVFNTHFLKNSQLH